MHDYFLRLIKGAVMAKGLGDLMKQMQAMQAKMEQMQEELAEKRLDGVRRRVSDRANGIDAEEDFMERGAACVRVE